MKKTALIVALLGACASHTAMAAEQTCSTEALMAANADVQSQFETYARAQVAEGTDPDDLNGEMLDIMQAANADETLSRHRDELEMMEPGSDHQPSQALCEDMYAMLDRLSAEMDQRQ